MPPDIVDSFAESVDRTADSCLRATTETFEEALESVVVDPAVGVPLPFEDVSLAATSVIQDPSVEDLAAAETGVTPASLGIANYGSVSVDAGASGDELVSLYPQRHIAVLAASDVVPDMSKAFDQLAASFAEGANGRVLATGPSATADMGSLVEGVHGPADVHVIILEDR